MNRPECCPTCSDRTTRYCAPLRCYCGHPACPAFASFVEFEALDSQAGAA